MSDLGDVRVEVDGEWATITVSRAHSWSSRDGFVLEKCEPRDRGGCFRCRLRWLVHLWRMGNRVWYLP